MRGPQGFLHLMKFFLLVNADAMCVSTSHSNYFSSVHRSQQLSHHPYPTLSHPSPSPGWILIFI